VAHCRRRDPAHAAQQSGGSAVFVPVFGALEEMKGDGAHSGGASGTARAAWTAFNNRVRQPARFAEWRE